MTEVPIQDSKRKGLLQLTLHLPQDFGFVLMANTLDLGVHKVGFVYYNYHYFAKNRTLLKAISSIPAIDLGGKD